MDAEDQIGKLLSMLPPTEREVFRLAMQLDRLIGAAHGVVQQNWALYEEARKTRDPAAVLELLGKLADTAQHAMASFAAVTLGAEQFIERLRTLRSCADLPVAPRALKE